MDMEVTGPMLWLDKFDSDIDPLVLYVLAAVSAINLVLAVALLILGCVFRQDTPGSSTNFYVAFGGMALVACVVIQGLDPGYMTEAIMEDLCQVYPTLLCLGMAAFTGGLLVRAGTIFGFHHTKGPRKMRKQEWKPNLWMLFLLVAEAAPILVWVILYDLKGDYVIDAVKGNYTECTSDEYGWWKLGLSAYHGFLVLLAAIFVWPAIYFSKKTVSSIDANLVCAAVYNLLFVVAAAVVVHIIYNTTPTYMYAIGGGLMQYVVFLTLGLLIAAKLCVARKLKGEDGEGYYSQMDGEKSKGGSGSYRPDDLYVNDSAAEHPGIAETFSY